MTCSKCGETLALGAKFCRKCGTPAASRLQAQPPLAIDCSTCGATVQPGKRFCKSCGASISLIPPEPTILETIPAAAQRAREAPKREEPREQTSTTPAAAPKMSPNLVPKLIEAEVKSQAAATAIKQQPGTERQATLVTADNPPQGGLTAATPVASSAAPSKTTEPPSPDLRSQITPSAEPVTVAPASPGSSPRAAGQHASDAVRGEALTQTSTPSSPTTSVSRSRNWPLLLGIGAIAMAIAVVVATLTSQPHRGPAPIIISGPASSHSAGGHSNPTTKAPKPVGKPTSAPSGISPQHLNKPPSLPSSVDVSQENRKQDSTSAAVQDSSSPTAAVVPDTSNPNPRRTVVYEPLRTEPQPSPVVVPPSSPAREETVTVPPPVTPNPMTVPQTGFIVWKGQVDKNGTIEIDSENASPGSINAGLPGVPVTIDLDTKNYALVEYPSATNGWKHLKIRSRNRKDAIIIKWQVAH